MGLISTEVEVKLVNRMIKYYEDLGYEIPRYINNDNKLTVKMGTTIFVKVEDLQDSSNILVDVQCDHCGEIIRNIQWHYYKKTINKYGKYYCRKCVNNLFCKEKRMRTILKNSKSFYNWCYDNLLKEEADNILSRWDYELNINKNGYSITPKDITYSSIGFNKKGYWFKCLEYPEHGSELKNIDRFTQNYKGFMGSITCNQCNTISITYPHLIKYLVNKEDAYKYSLGSHKNILMNCLICGHEKEMKIPNLIRSGFSCDGCGDKIPYGEKVFNNFIKQLLNSNYTNQLSSKSFKWCNKYRYDFYIPKINGICETHGIQHYEQTSGNWDSLQEIQGNDNQKEQLAKQNNIKHYIIIDCRYPDIEWIKNSIMTSELPQLLNFKEEDIDWLKCHEYGCSSLVKEVCDLWNIKNKNIVMISKEIKIGVLTVRKYLKQGAKLGWCNYDAKKEMCREVICLTTGELFSSLTDASKKYKTHISSITNCCKGNVKSSGVLSDGTKLIWMYYEDYINNI